MEAGKRKSKVHLLNEKKKMISEVITRLDLIDDLNILRVVEKLDATEKESIKNVCNRICSNLDDTKCPN